MQHDLNNILKIGALPDLRIISLSDLVLHEEPEPNRFATLLERLRVEGQLKNPPIVARADGHDKFVLLDGTNRVSALQKWGFEHIVVQVVAFADPLLSLQTWHHAVEGVKRETFIEQIESITGIEIETVRVDPAAIQDHVEFPKDANTLCFLTFRDGGMLEIRGALSLVDRAGFYRTITDVYLAGGKYDRVSYTNLDYLKNHYPDFSALVSFMPFSPDNVLSLIEHEIRLPGGIVRIFLPKRALGLNIALDFLRSVSTVEEKNRRLAKMIMEKVKDKSIRFYAEPTFVFDQ